MGNTAQKKNNLAPTPASDWAGAIAIEGKNIPLPSGNVARCRQVEPTAFLEGGFLPDPLTQLVRKAIQSKAGLKPQQIKNLVDDPEQLKASMQTIDRVVIYVMAEPVVLDRPECVALVELDGPDEDGTVCEKPWYDPIHQVAGTPHRHVCVPGPREPGALYVDVLTLEDKLFIFQWALGGTSSLEQFRKEQRANVGALADRQGVRKSAKRTPARK